MTAYPGIYQVAQGHDQASLSALPTTYDPRVSQFAPRRETRTLDGTVYHDGGWVAEMTFDALRKDEFDALMTALGLDWFTTSAEITIDLPFLGRGVLRWNAQVTYPFDAEYVRGHYGSVVLQVTLLNTISAAFDAGFDEGYE